MRFFVAGVPVPKGSARSFKHSRTGAVITIQANAAKQQGWRERIYPEARRAIPRPSDGPVEVDMDFIFNHRKADLTSKGAPKPRAPFYKTTSPDLDKLIRCVLDALTGIAYRDDAQVIRIEARKRYGMGGCGAWITVLDLALEQAADKPW